MQDRQMGLHASRRRILAGGAGVAAALAMAGRATAETSPGAEGQFLFVQTSRGMSYDAAAKRLTLTGVSPVTLFFSDRPERVAGNMRTAHFEDFWKGGKDSFLQDPPNADLSILEGDTLRQVVVVLRDPRLEGEDLSYAVEVLEGDLPATGAEASLFIDVIGMPLTPLSYAGVARRNFRRAAIY